MTRKLNLQPWRSKRRENQKKTFVAITFAVLVLCAGVFSADAFIQKKYIKGQELAISQLRTEITSFKKAQEEVQKIKALNEEVNLQIDVIQALQNQRGLTVQILDHIALNTPESVFLSRIKFNNNELEVEGVAENDAGVSDFMREMRKFQYFDVPEIKGITQAVSNDRFQVRPNTEVKTFVVKIKVKQPSAENS